MKISVIVPAYNAAGHIRGLLESLSRQSGPDFETIIVDDGSADNTAPIVKSYGCRLVQLRENHGPAFCRNLGARKAGGDILVFTDADCRPDPDWLKKIQGHFSRNDVAAIMGRLELPRSNYLGDSISALGFPAGGAIGFEKIWRVDPNGCTRSLSTCNCAIRSRIFWEAGGFDETFPYPGGEDSLLAYKLSERDYKIRFCPDVIVCHEARDSLAGFMKWQFRRGVSSFIFSRRVKTRRNFISLRIWSTKNIMLRYCRDYKFPMILFLIAMSFTAQLGGFFFAKYNRNFS
jgi:glycosyltransferase involved in cell wall biosynthesis